MFAKLAAAYCSLDDLVYFLFIKTFFAELGNGRVRPGFITKNRQQIIIGVLLLLHGIMAPGLSYFCYF